MPTRKITRSRSTAKAAPPPFEGFDLEGLPQLCQALRSDEFRQFAGLPLLRFDRLAHAPCAGGAPLGRADAERIREAFARYAAGHGRAGWNGPQAEVERAIAIVSREHPFHPVAEYLEALSWDGERRLDRIAAEVLAVDRGGAACASRLIRKWCLAAVARAFEPGCAADGVLVLVGEGRLPLDLFLRTLVPARFYGDAPADPGGKSQDGLRSSWVYSCHGLPEQTGGERGEAFSRWIAATTDPVDGPFATAGEHAPRTSVFASTVETLPDVTSPGLARRLWAVPVGQSVDAGKLAGWRDQLWAEALAEHRKGSSRWLEPTEDEQRAAVARCLGDGDPWTEHAFAYMAKHAYAPIDDVLSHVEAAVLDAPPRRREWPLRERRRMGRVLRSLGHSRQRLWISGVKTVVWAPDGTFDPSAVPTEGAPEAKTLQE